MEGDREGGFILRYVFEGGSSFCCWFHAGRRLLVCLILLHIPDSRKIPFFGIFSIPKVLDEEVEIRLQRKKILFVP